MSRRLCDRGGVHRVLRRVPPERNSPIYGSGTYLMGGQLLSDVASFKRERRLLSCDGFFLGMRPLWKPSYYLIQPSRYDQILTKVLPYRGSTTRDMLLSIRDGKRPSRTIDSDQNLWLQDPVWDVITSGWRDQPKRRCKLSVMYHIFSPPSQRPQTEKILPRIASYFRFLQNSESEIQRQVNEMNEASSSMSLLPKADMTHSALRMVPCRIGSG